MLRDKGSLVEGGVTPYYIISFTSVVGQWFSDRRGVTPYYIAGLTAVVGHGLSDRRGVTPYYIVSLTFVVALLLIVHITLL